MNDVVVLELISQSMKMASLRTVPRELALALMCCSSRESGPYTLPGQHSRTSPEDVGVGDLTLRT